MKIFAYDYENFKDVLSILDIIENSTNPDSYGRILFNRTDNRFEFFEAKEINKIDIHKNYGSVREAIELYKKVADSNEINAVNDLIPDTESLEVNEELESPAEVEEIIPFDEVFENSQNILKSIKNIQKMVDLERKEKLVQIISDIYKMDTVSESDILKTIVENTELKKLLSLVFETFGVEVSKTVSTKELKVSTATIKFNHKIENTIEDYKQGIAQALANIRAIKASRDEIKAIQELLETTQKALAQEKKASIELSQQVVMLTEQKSPIRELKTIIPLTFVIFWKTEKGTIDFLRVRKDKLGSATEDGSFPTKYLERTSHLTKAQHFSNTAANAQIAKMIQYKQNVTCVKLADMSPRTLKEFFTVGRVALEKIEAVRSAE